MLDRGISDTKKSNIFYPVRNARFLAVSVLLSLVPGHGTYPAFYWHVLCKELDLQRYFWTSRVRCGSSPGSFLPD